MSQSMEIRAAGRSGEPGDRLLRRTEAAQLLGMSASTLAVWKCKGKADAPPVIILSSRSVRYSERALREWAERHSR